MGEEINIYLPKSVVDKINAQNVEKCKWERQVVILGLAITEGRIYQQIEECDYSVKLADVMPIAALPREIHFVNDTAVEEKVICAFTLGDDLVSFIRRVSQTDPAKWFLSALNARLNYKDLKLGKVTQNGQFIPLVYRRIPQTTNIGEGAFN